VSSLHLITRRIAVAGLLTLPIITAAQAQGRFEARYGITAAGIPIGTAGWSLDIGGDQYLAQANGRATGALAAMVNGEGTVLARGSLKDGRPVPARFDASITRDGDRSDIKMALDNGAVKDLTAEIGKPAPDRIPLTDAHRKGIVDPLSALLVPITGEQLTAEACQRTLSIFDGRRRYDLKLAFKRMDKVKAEKGYAGPVAVCAVTFQPQAGHRASSALVKYLSEGREIELWLAPVAGARLLAPFRVSVASMLGNLVVEAKQFEVLSKTAAAR